MTSIAWPELQMVGRSDAIAEIDSEIECAAGSTARVLISGEAGSGKELIAWLIHQRSHRPATPFVTVNCAGVPDDELESELFAHARGGFTPGRGGTVLLEEVAEISPRIQDVLFKLLGTGLDIRLIAVTTRDLHADVIAGKFREDLYYRLNVLHVCVPPYCNTELPIGVLPTKDRMPANRQHTSDVNRQSMIDDLRELITALNRRVPRFEGTGEVVIARDAAALRDKALARIAELERSEH